MSNNDDAREEKTKAYMLDQAKRAIALRSKDREFHGLEREFMYHQSQMLIDYDKSKDVKHPRDVGNVREVILREFLANSGYLPKRYGVSQNSTRAASPTGHISKEIDIFLYDPLDSVCLMNREHVYEVLPIECVYGVIQVKSRLNKKEIKDGLENLASFKRLDRPSATQAKISSLDPRHSKRGFGILFAYDSDLEWLEIVQEIETFAKKQPNHLWCNGVFILNRGAILHGDDKSSKFENVDLEKISTPKMYGFPDRQGQCLYQFHSLLLSLLRNTTINPAKFDSYFRLPLVAGDHSYEFYFGGFAEFGTCDKHGDYQRKMEADQLTKVIEWCSTSTPINWIRATDIAYGKPGDNEEAYARQPGDVRIYNPENLPLSDILVRDSTLNDSKTGATLITKALSFDQIRCAGMTVYIPYYYSIKEGIINICPKCIKRIRANAKKGKTLPI